MKEIILPLFTNDMIVYMKNNLWTLELINEFSKIKDQYSKINFIYLCQQQLENKNFKYAIFKKNINYQGINMKNRKVQNITEGTKGLNK